MRIGKYLCKYERDGVTAHAWVRVNGRMTRLSGLFRGEFPILPPAVVADLGRDLEIHRCVAREPGEEGPDLKDLILIRQPHLAERRDLPRLVSFIWTSVSDLVKLKGPERKRDRPETIAELFDAWELERVLAGAKKPELAQVHTLSRLAGDHLGRRCPIDVEPTRWEEVRDAMIASGMIANTINRYFRLLKRIYSWAAYLGWVDERIAGRLSRMPSVAQDACRLSKAVEAVSDQHVESTLNCGPGFGRYKAMIRFQRLTGCRPGEMCRMRWDHITRDTNDPGRPWRWTVHHHKTSHRTKKPKTYIIGPKAQEILERLFKPSTERDSPYVFQTKNGRHIELFAYRRAIRRMCDKAGVPRWLPNQLRHARATEVSAKFGAMAEAASLGHTAKVAQAVYVERDMELAELVALEIG